MPRKRKPTRLAANIRYLRMRGDYTQEFIGELIGVSRFAVCKYEAGDRVPNNMGLRKLAHLFSVTVDDLLNEDMSGAFTDKEEVNT